ncbi:MAG TPA: winged helix-turn-helix domain-containing protein [Terracidiphilus sp.]|nr:winged helix-turn-helix domain-containing protein [Terracidiphilus sp.]
MVQGERVLRFGAFELDPYAGELRKRGVKVRLSGQPLQLLAILLQSPGRLVSREDIQRQIWPTDTFVDFDHGLNNAICRIRGILADLPQSPRFIETLPRRGYRFIGQVEETAPFERRLSRNAAWKTESAQDRPPSQSLALPDETRQRGGSVAVLPFVNLSTDSENDFFADGITEDVIAHLAKIKALKVISRTSVMAFKKTLLSLREIGEKLGAATILEGSVRRDTNRVRIVAQLVDAATDEHVWSETYDRDLTDIFAIQTDVALNIANALRAELSKDERTRLSRWPTYNLDAYDLYLRGRHWFYRFTEEGYQRSIVAVDGAIALDPGFAKAWAAIAEAHAGLCMDGFVGGSPDESIALAKLAVAKALEMDEELAEAHGILGLIRFAFDFDWAGAEQELRKALELCPGNAQIHDYYGWLCFSQERYDDALREVRRARDLDPIIIHSDVAATLLRAGRNEEALDEARRMVTIESGSPRCNSMLGWALIFNGDHAAGIASLEHSVALAPGLTMFQSQLGQAYALIGNIEKARLILEELHDRATREFVSPYHFAYIHTGLGEADLAIDWLERAYEKRSGYTFAIKGSFLFRNLRGLPRFESLLRRMNLA